MIVKILLVDDHPIVREGYHRLLERQPEFHVCAEADNAEAAYRAYKEHRPHVVVMDLALPGASGLEATRHIRQWDKDAKILVFSMHLGAAFALKAFAAGAIGYVTKSSEPGDLVRAVKFVAGGGRFLSEDISRAIAADRLAGPENVIEHLGPRETEILRLLASGMSSDAIAELLCLSPKTVRNYHYAIKTKLGAQTDTKLVWVAISAGLVSIENAQFKIEE